MVEVLVEKIRQKGFASLNFDLIYGLPKQTIKSVSNTIEEIKKLKPDLVAFYGYAHLPDKIKNQKLINPNHLPSPDEKRMLYETGKHLLTAAGYTDIGMDHFALPINFLAKAKVENKLHRNFMGYVDAKSNILLGLGPSAISDSSLGFGQNVKTMPDYLKLISSGKLAIGRSHCQSEDDQIIQKIIIDLMCQGKLPGHYSELPYANEIQEEIDEFIQDGILVDNGSELKITSIGEAFLRNIAQTFDFHSRESQLKAFSSSI